jgi:4'-phosphopantetheinyl transferase
MNALPVHVELGMRTIHLGWTRIDDADDTLLTAKERQLAGRTTTPKRKREFVAGRMAAHRCVDAACAARVHCDILAQPGGFDAGRPIVVPSRGLSISISHSGRWAVAASAHGAPLGVDIERVDLNPEPSFIQEAFAAGELESWNLKDAPAGTVSLPWACKEAVLKVWGVGLRAALGQVSIAPQGDFATPGRPFSLRAQWLCESGTRKQTFAALAWRAQGLVIVVVSPMERHARRGIDAQEAS